MTYENSDIKRNWRYKMHHENIFLFVKTFWFIYIGVDGVWLQLLWCQKFIKTLILVFLKAYHILEMDK